MCRANVDFASAVVFPSTTQNPNNFSINDRLDRDFKDYQFNRPRRLENGSFKLILPSYPKYKC